MSQPAEIADAVVAAIHSGDVAWLRQLLGNHPAVASAPLGGRYKSRTPLLAVADWPGYFANGPEMVWLLVEAGADPNAGQPGEETRFTGRKAATIGTSRRRSSMPERT